MTLAWRTRCMRWPGTPRNRNRTTRARFFRSCGTRSSTARAVPPAWRTRRARDSKPNRPCAIWADKVRGNRYAFDRREVGDKPAVVVGYAMTEKQGGSDLRETQTAAVFSHSDDYHGGTAHWYALTGHKWFCSVPQADGFFTLARVNGGVTCFFLPRTLPDGSYNRFFIQRLKDKCGNQSNASSEIEYRDSLAIRVGEEGAGIREILSHAHLTRLDFAIGSAGLMRQALTLALNHAGTREAFGGPLLHQPMMAGVLADMAVEVEAATLLALRVAKATDHLGEEGQERRSPAWPRRWRNSSTVRAPPRSRTRRCSATAAMASSRRIRSRDCIARRRSTASGKARRT